MPEVIEEKARARLRAALALDEHRARELQKTLGLDSPWNVTPDDLVASERRGIGSLLSVFRRAARPAVRLFANIDRPLFKQFKINLGMADMLDELLCRTAELQGQVEDLSRRLEELEASADTGAPTAGSAGRPVGAAPGASGDGPA